MGGLSSPHINTDKMQRSASYGTSNHSKCDGNCNTSEIMTAHEMDQMKYDITAILGKNGGENWMKDSPSGNGWEIISVA